MEALTKLAAFVKDDKDGSIGSSIAKWMVQATVTDRLSLYENLISFLDYDKVAKKEVDLPDGVHYTKKPLTALQKFLKACESAPEGIYGGALEQFLAMHTEEDGNELVKEVMQLEACKDWKDNSYTSGWYFGGGNPNTLSEFPEGYSDGNGCNVFPTREQHITKRMESLFTIILKTLENGHRVPDEWRSESDDLLFEYNSLKEAE